jgi:diguanylate cyclase (GGDEF)-like protein
MGTAAQSFLNPISADGAVAPSHLSAEALARRAKQRRQIQGMIGVSYVIDSVVLLIYAYAGTTKVWVGPAYALSGLTLMTVTILLSETGFNERFRDHYLVAPYSAANIVILLAFTYIAPEVGVMFLCSLFTVFSFASLRSTPGQTALLWTAMALGLACLYLLTDKPIAMPHGGHIERFATMTAFILTIGRSMFLGSFSSALKHSLYQRGLKLKEAYNRIEELAELDELTGAFNRRCIMRMLDEEIARASRSGSPCSIALIDLDHFKRVNDTLGHDGGDEVLRVFARLLRNAVPTGALVARMGGEEFAILASQDEKVEAEVILARLRGTRMPFDVKVTASIGTCTGPLSTEPEWKALYRGADKALFEAKSAGRDRARVAQGLEAA